MRVSDERLLIYMLVYIISHRKMELNLADSLKRLALADSKVALLEAGSVNDSVVVIVICDCCSCNYTD